MKKPVYALASLGQYDIDGEVYIPVRRTILGALYRHTYSRGQLVLCLWDEVLGKQVIATYARVYEPTANKWLGVEFPLATNGEQAVRGLLALDDLCVWADYETLSHEGKVALVQATDALFQQYFGFELDTDRIFGRAFARAIGAVVRAHDDLNRSAL